MDCIYVFLNKPPFDFGIKLHKFGYRTT